MPRQKFIGDPRMEMLPAPPSFPDAAFKHSKRLESSSSRPWASRIARSNTATCCLAFRNKSQATKRTLATVSTSQRARAPVAHTGSFRNWQTERIDAAPNGWSWRTATGRKTTHPVPDRRSVVGIDRDGRSKREEREHGKGDKDDAHGASGGSIRPSGGHPATHRHEIRRRGGNVDPRLDRQMVRGDPRQRRVVHLDARDQTLRIAEDAVECE